MKHLTRLLAIILCLGMVFGLAACEPKPADSTTEPSYTESTPTTEPAGPTAAEIYDGAKAAIESAADLELAFTATETKTFNGERYEQTTSRTISLTGRGTDAFAAQMTETVTQGDVTFTSTEVYDGATVYTDFEGALYCADMTSDDYLARLLPEALLDSSLYGTVTAEGNTLTFSDPAAGESWAMYDTAVLTEAAGTATLTDNGSLSSTSYSASFTYGAMAVTMDVEVGITIPADGGLSLTVPEDTSAYQPLKYIDAPKMAELAIATISDTNTANASITHYLYSELSEHYVYGTFTVTTCGPAQDLLAKYESSYELGEGNEVIRSGSESKVFQDGVWSDGDDTNASDSKALLLEHLIWALPHGVDLSGGKITDTGALFLLELDGNDTYAQSIYDRLCEELFADDPSYLDDQASAYSIRDMEFTLSIDKYTGFPVFFSFGYEGRHTVDGTKYSHHYDLEVTYELGAATAYETITGQLPPDEEPENKATPLFYHVTGADGQEMWLLGTIHVGDDRTAYLPREIYDAFDASNALAVEVDVIAFEEQLLTDKKLQTQYSLAVQYLNGSTVKDHVSKEVYSAAMDMAKAMGIYSEDLVYYKAGLLYSYLSGYYDRCVPEYLSGKGVDMRLLTMAKEQNKTILEIEEGLDQVSMFTTCSRKLQEYLLISALGTDAAEYHDGLMEMYETWCAGDEAAMRELVTDDLTDITEEELELYNEYNRIMMTDRNALMLQTAIDYLESGDVIFYAVGAAHVLAEDGLVNTLRDAGYTVELVTYAE